MKYPVAIICIFFLMVALSAADPVTAQVSSNVNPNVREADSLFQSGGGQWAKMKALYESVTPLELNPVNWSRMGFANYHLGHYDDALKDYQQVIGKKTAPALRAITYSRIAKVYALRNDIQNAIAALDSAVGNGYANLGEMDTLTDFNSIRKEARFQAARKAVYAGVYPCMVNAHAREFDFWIGEWNVFATGTKNYAGHSLIQMISNGCALLENWDNPASNGKSINYIDPGNNKWKQAWVGSYAGGTQEFVDGEYKDGAMRFTFETRTPQGQKAIGRFIFYNQKPGQVRQFSETSVDGGKTWVTSIDLTYIRKE